MVRALQEGPAVSPTLPAPRPVRKTQPVVWWAVFGVACLAVAAWAWTSWLTSGGVHGTPTGPEPVPTYMKVFVRGSEIFGWVAFPVFIYYVAVRPWRREGKITTDGLLCLAFFLATWQDPGLNFIKPWFLYGQYFIDWGSWLPHIPFGPEGTAHLVQPVTWNFFGYVYIWFGVGILGSHLLRKAKARWPDVSNLRLIVFTCVLCFVFDFLLELGWQFSGVDTYPGGHRWLTIFHGHYYQVPIYEIIMAIPWWAGAIFLRYFRDDRGLTLVEKGVSALRLSPKKRTLVRFFALFGAVNALWFAYNIPAAYLGGHLFYDAWPADVVSRSYFVNGYCGPNEARPCPGWTRDGRIDIGPDGARLTVRYPDPDRYVTRP